MHDQNKTAGENNRSHSLYAALKNPYNLLALAIIVAATAMSLSIWPLAIGLGLELIYLVIVGRCMAIVKAASAAVQDGNDQVILKQTPARRKANPHNAVDAASQSDLSEPEPPDDLAGDIARVEAVFRLIALRLDDKVPVNHQILTQLDILMERYVYFTDREEQFTRRLSASAAAAGQLRPLGDSPVMVDLRLVNAANDPDRASPFERRVETWIKQAHEGFEREMRSIAEQREHSLDPQTCAELERVGQALLARNRIVDKIGKALLNLRYQRQLLEKKFNSTSQELATARPDQLLSDLRALILQTKSLTRTVEELDPQAGLIETIAA